MLTRSRRWTHNLPVALKLRPHGRETFLLRLVFLCEVILDDLHCLLRGAGQAGHLDAQRVGGRVHHPGTAVMTPRYRRAIHPVAYWSRSSTWRSMGRHASEKQMLTPLPSGPSTASLRGARTAETTASRECASNRRGNKGSPFHRSLRQAPWPPDWRPSAQAIPQRSKPRRPFPKGGNRRRQRTRLRHRTRGGEGGCREVPEFRRISHEAHAPTSYRKRDDLAIISCCRGGKRGSQACAAPDRARHGPSFHGVASAKKCPSRPLLAQDGATWFRGRKVSTLRCGGAGRPAQPPIPSRRAPRWTVQAQPRHGSRHDRSAPRTKG